MSQKGDGEAISVAALSTLVGCASGGITVLFTWKFHPIGGKWSLSRIINGCLAGMVAVCAGCNKYYPWISGIIGSLGLIYMTFLTLRVPNTQSATGILYAATIVVFIGELTARVLADNVLYPL